MTLDRLPEDIAGDSFRAIDHMAYVNRPDEGKATIIVDGSMYSPSTRACPYAEHVYQNGNDAEWEIFQDELDQLTEAYAHGGYSLGWDDGCLWLYSPGYMPED